nr:hypothetical protein [Tanacetum cinerariifolium]
MDIETEVVTDDKGCEKSLNVPSGDYKVVLLPDLNQLADDEKLSPAASKDEMETQDRWRRFSREDKSKGVLVVDVERDMEIDIGEKGKGKLIEINSSLSDSGGPDNMDEDFVLGNGTRIGLEEKGKEKVVNKASPVVVTEIEPLTPDKQTQPMTNNNSETTPASSSHKLGLVVSSDSGRVLRRSARLSLNSTYYNVASRKRKAVDCSGLRVTDGVVCDMDIETEVVTDDKGCEKSLNVPSGDYKVVLLPDLNQLADDEK